MGVTALGRRAIGQIRDEPKPHPRVKGSVLAPEHLVMSRNGVWAEVHRELLFPRAQHQHSTFYTVGRLGGCSGPLYCDED